MPFSILLPTDADRNEAGGGERGRFTTIRLSTGMVEFSITQNQPRIIKSGTGPCSVLKVICITQDRAAAHSADSQLAEYNSNWLLAVAFISLPFDFAHYGGPEVKVM